MVPYIGSVGNFGHEKKWYMASQAKYDNEVRDTFMGGVSKDFIMSCNENNCNVVEPEPKTLLHPLCVFLANGSRARRVIGGRACWRG